MRALLQNPPPAAAGVRPASVTASMLAAERDAGAARAPEQGFAHLLQDSQRRSALDSAAAQPAVTAPAPAKSAPTPAPETSTPARRDAVDAVDAAHEGDGEARSDGDRDGDGNAAADATPTVDAAQPKDKGRPRLNTRSPGRAAEKTARDAGPTDQAAETAAPGARRLAAASDAPAASTAPAPSGVDAVLAQWQAARQSMAPADGKSSADGSIAAGTGNAPANGRGNAGAEALLASADLDRSASAEMSAAISTAAMARNDESAALTARPAFDKQLSRSLEAIVAPATASGAPAPGATVEAGAISTVNVPAPVDSPEFAPALAMQVSLLASDGIQQAELHLNPAEMGPVSVQISLDGTQAHVSFGADLPATRQAIEAGLPDLAGALREAGFTLAGGGVSEHAREQRQPSSDSGPGGDGRRDGRAHAGAQTIVAALRHTTRAGGIDLYA